MTTMENYKEESCKFLLPCGMCEFTKQKCTKWNIVDDIFTVSPAPYQPTPLNIKEWKIGDWPPRPQPTCKDLASDPDTFRVHFEDQPRYSDACTSTSTYNPNITAEANNFDINSVKQKLTNEK